MKTKYVFLFLIAAGIYCLGLVQTMDPDLWWHLKTGELILKQGVPKVDPFSFTVTGKPWVAHEWLSEVILRLLFGLGGLPALMIAFALFGIFIFGFVYRLCPGKPFLAGTLTFLAFFASRYLWGPRPQIFNILMMAVFMWLLQSVRAGTLSRKWLYALVPLTMLWVNLHSGYVLGIGVMLIFLTADIFQIFVLHSEEGTVGRKNLQPFIFAIFLCLVGGIANPAGYKIYLYPFETLGSQIFQASILEWQTPTFHHWNYWPFLGIMVIGVFAFMKAPSRLNVADFLLYAGSMATGLFARRHIPFFAIVATPIVAKALWEAFPALRWRDALEDRNSLDQYPEMRLFVNPVLAILIAAGIFYWTQYRLKEDPAFIARNYPVSAVQFMKDKGIAQRKGYSEYLWGGYLIWNNIPVFIDGRADLYGDKFFQEFLAMHDLKREWAYIQKTFDQTGVDYVLLQPSGPMQALLRQENKDWREVYADRTASVFVRKALLQEKNVPPAKTARPNLTFSLS